ncbi:MAG: extracellular solute-binding protein [Actinobacteria bacterium]|nr:extracellular solute-binding protein [Actinomycetota bacterium]
MEKTRLRARAGLAALAGLALIASACGSEPPTSSGADGGTGDDATATEAATTPDEGTESEAAQSGGSDAMDNSAALEEVYAQLEGLEGEDRTAKLVELADEEEGLNIYSSTNLDDAEPLLAAFEDKFDIEPNYYRASSSDVLQRILQENDANYAGNDVLMANGPEMALADREGLLLPLTSPATEDIIEAGVFDTWASVYVNTFIAAWNTNEVTDPPATWEELLTDFDGLLAMELGDWDWFATITNRYFIEQQGMTEEEVVEMFKEAARDARIVDGHTLMAELVVAGEYDAGTSLYHHRVAEFIDEGAPIQWEPPLKPMILRPNGVGIMKAVQNPATALLWTEFLLTDAQTILAEDFRGPASTAVEGGIPEEYEPILVDIDAITDERDKWEGLWEEIVSQSGQPVIE